MRINDTINRQHTGQMFRDIIEQAGIDLDWLDKGKLTYGHLERIAQRLERSCNELRDMHRNGPQCER